MNGAIGEGKYEKACGRGQGHSNAWILTSGINALFGLYLFCLAFYGDASRFHALFISAGFLAVWLERIDPHPKGSRNFRRLFFCAFILSALIFVISLFGAMDLPGMKFTDRNNDGFYGIVIALTLGMGIRDRKSIHRLLWLMLIFFGGWSIVEFFSLSPETSFVTGRFVGIKNINPNIIAMGLLILFSVFTCYAFIVRGKRIFGLMLCGLGATTLLLLLTKSRSSLLTAAFVTVPVALITQRRLLNFKKRLIAACIVFLLITPLLAFVWYSNVETERKSPVNAIKRFHTWQISLEMTTHRPWYRLFIGHGSIKGVNIKIADQFELDFPDGHSHNIFFQTLLETGMLGLMTLIFIFGIALQGVYREWKVNKHASGDLSAVFITTIATILTVGQMDHVLLKLPGKLVWIILGLALAYGKLGYQESALRKSVQERHAINSPTV